MYNETRRDFIANGAKVAVSGALVTQFTGSVKASASERVRVGIIGAGGRAMTCG